MRRLALILGLSFALLMTAGAAAAQPSCTGHGNPSNTGYVGPGTDNCGVTNGNAAPYSPVKDMEWRNPVWSLPPWWP